MAELLREIPTMPQDEAEDAVKELLADCLNSTATYARTFFPHACFRPFDKVHHQIFELIDDQSIKKAAIAVPRGLGKTTLVNVVYASKAVVYHMANYIVPVSSSAPMAWEQSDNLKIELIENRALRDVFGTSKTKKFGKERWVARVGGSDGHEVCVFPRGAGQAVRGMKWGIYRPDLILVDDYEDPEGTDSEEQRAKKEKRFFADLMNCVDRGSNSWRVLVVGTVLHQDSLLVHLLDSKHWDTISIPICDPNFTVSYAPHFKTIKEVLELKQEFSDEEQLDEFFREYMNEPTPTGKDATFQKGFFKYYNTLTTKFDGPEWKTIVLVDPAKKTTKRSVQSAVVGVSFNQTTGGIYVRDVVAGKLHLDAKQAQDDGVAGGLIRETIDMMERLRATAVGIETAGLGEFGMYPFKTNFFREKVYVELIELKAKGGHDEKGKVKRIRSMVPFYRAGLVFHNPAVCHGLEAQLISFPRSKFWDIMDALSYFIQVFDLAELHALGESDRIAVKPGDVKDAEDEDDFYEEYDETAYEVEREFRELYRTYERPIEGWRAGDPWGA